MEGLKLSYEEIEKFVNHLSDEEFNFLREAIYERLLEDVYEQPKIETQKTYQKTPKYQNYE